MEISQPPNRRFRYDGSESGPSEILAGLDAARTRREYNFWEQLPGNLNADEITAADRCLKILCKRWADAYNSEFVFVYVINLIVTAVPIFLLAMIACQRGCNGAGPPWRDLDFWWRSAAVVCGLAACLALIFIFVPDPSPLRVSNKHVLSYVLACFAVMGHYALAWDQPSPPSPWHTGLRVGLLVAGLFAVPFLFLNNLLYNVLLHRWLGQIVESHPIEAIAYALKEVLNGCEDDARPKTVQDLSETALDLDLAGAALERGLCNKFKLNDPRRSASLKKDCAEMAGTLYKLQRLVLFPDSSAVQYTRTIAGKALISVLSGNWEDFPREADPRATVETSQREWVDYLRLMVIAILPGVGVALLYNLPSLPIDPASQLAKAKVWVYAIAGLWFIFTALRALDPDLGTTLQSFSTLLGGLSQVRTGKGKDNV
jgi:hypothetical protein